MGQGYSSVTLPAGPSIVETADLADLTFEKPLGGARFLRTVRARHRDGVVVAKVCMKSSSGISFKQQAASLRAQTKALKDVPNTLPYQRIRETALLGILVRQYVHTSLYDRISIRPFLENIEKKWIAFQLLCAVRDCHSRGIFHGDIKTENVLVTSWGWIYLTDFASAFKPVYLPEDNPADFSFYYDTSARRVCYLAPERFLASGQEPREGNIVQWNMDIFSLGCVLAELFTEAPTFTLSQLFRYRKGEYDPTLPLLNKVDDEHVRALIGSMIRLDPGERWHAQDYLDEYKGKAFPLYFYNHLHTLMQEITDPSSGRNAVPQSEGNNGESDERIDRIYNDYEMLSVSLEYQNDRQISRLNKIRHPHQNTLFPLEVDLPNSRHTAHSAQAAGNESGTFILLNVIVASIRNCARASTKVRGCELLLAFAERLSDEAKLDRVLPYIMLLLDDSNELVLIAALRTMTQVLGLVRAVSPVNSFLFTQYIFPKLQSFVKGPGFTKNAIVRATYAACLASLAETASRFLDIMQALRETGSLSSSDKLNDPGLDVHLSYDDTYDATRLEMLDQFEGQTKVFLTDTDNAVRRAFLTSVSSLCVFFGEARASDVMLSHLNTYLNDQDWLLKCAFFKTIVGVAVYVGGASLEEFILPLVLQALTDPQEAVIEQAIRSLASIAELGLLQRAKTWELIDIVARFQWHPNIWIKEAASHFISASTTYLSTADVRILLAPLIQPYLKVTASSLNESELLDALKKPLPRAVLDLALQWAGGADKSDFWNAAKDSRLVAQRARSQMPPQSTVAESGGKALSKILKTDEDEQWLGRLRNAGMRVDDEIKLVAFREYLGRASQRMKRDTSSEPSQTYDQILSLTRLQVTPLTVIFDNDAQTYEDHLQIQRDRTITEALQEASNPAKKSLSPGILGDEFTLNQSARLLPQGGDVLRQPDSLQPGKQIAGLRRPASGSLSSSPTSGLGLLGKDSERDPTKRTGGVSLLTNLDVRGKASAEVATNDSTAAGKLHRPNASSRISSPAPHTATPPKRAERTISSRTIHNYEGNDPTVLKLLDAVYARNFPVEAAEFGPLVQPVSGPIPTNEHQATGSPWRSKGQLLAVLGEHTARVTRILPAPDHTFFLTAADDGAVKVWDCQRLERNVTHRSRQTFRLAPGVKVTSICFVETTHAFICAGSDGSLCAVKVEVADSNSAIRYGRLQTVREWNIPSSPTPGEYAVWMEHFKGDSASTLIIATNLGRIIAFDLKNMSILYEMQNPAKHGEPSCFCVGRKHDWLLIGTAHGVLDLWDLRFQVRLRAWTFSGGAPISRLQLHPSRKSSRRYRFCVTGGTGPGEMSIWDAEKGICHEIIRPAYPHNKERLQLRDYELHNLEDERAESLLSRVSGSVAAHASHLDHHNMSSPASQMSSIFGLQKTSKDPDAQLLFAISGGPDGKVRFWDCERLEGCSVVSGASPEGKPTYTFSQLSLDTRVLSERPPSSAPAPAPQLHGQPAAIESSKITPDKRNTAAAGAAAPRPPFRYDTIRMSAQRLFAGHLDTVTDVAMIERPFGMIVSADRSGQVFVHI